MAKNAKNESALKARQTKLSKKSNSELIDIILRKDKVERNLNNNIVLLKKEINCLNANNEKLIEVKNKIDKELSSTKASFESISDNYADNINHLKISLDSINNKYYNENKKVVELTKKCNLYKNISVLLIAVFVVTIAIVFVQ